jgi:hypothetical protein
MKNTLKRILLVIGGLFLIPWGAAQAQTTIRMEAEDMTLDTYKVESLSFASNGALINLKGPGVVGSATAAFPGETGAYDITVVYHDENDGVAQLSVSIAGNTVDSWSLDKSISGGQQPEEFNRFTREITTGYEISNGDEIRIDGLRDQQWRRDSHRWPAGQLGPRQCRLHRVCRWRRRQHRQSANRFGFLQGRCNCR